MYEIRLCQGCPSCKIVVTSKCHIHSHIHPCTRPHINPPTHPPHRHACTHTHTTTYHHGCIDSFCLQNGIKKQVIHFNGFKMKIMIQTVSTCLHCPSIFWNTEIILLLSHQTSSNSFLCPEVEMPSYHLINGTIWLGIYQQFHEFSYFFKTRGTVTYLYKEVTIHSRRYQCKQSFYHQPHSQYHRQYRYWYHAECCYHWACH